MSKLIKDLGAVSAYAYAVEKGYTGTEDEFAELMYDYTDVAQTAVEAKDEAVSASASAQASATTANTKADEASASASKAQSASDSAQGAETNAETFALNAGTKATEAKQFADKAELNAQKTQSDKEAVESAKSDVLSAVDNAQNYANSAQSASQAIQNMDVKATTLEPDSEATVEKTVDAISGAVTLTYGIPKGQVGEKGDKGDTGDSGVYIGASAPSDENVNVWIDSDGEPDDVIQIDDTLTQSGQAADAKVVGDEIGDIKGGLTQCLPVVGIDSLLASGEATSANATYSKTILASGLSLKANTMYNVTATIASALTVPVYVYVSDSADQTLPSGSFNIPAGKTTATIVIGCDVEYTNAYLWFQLGVKSVTVSASISESYNNNIVDVVRKKVDDIAESGEYCFDINVFGRGGLSDGTVIKNIKYRVATYTTLTCSKDIHFTIASGYKFGVHSYYSNAWHDSGWKTTKYTITAGSLFRIVIAKSTEDTSITADIATFVNALKINSYLLDMVLRTIPVADNFSVIGNPFKSKPYFSHIGVSQTDNIIIPNQSIADVARAKRLGFDVIELNVRITADSKYVCIHGNAGAFGYQFVDTDGNYVNTVQVDSMTLQEIKDTIRYRSKYPRYRTAPFTLQEMLYECKKQGIMPLVEYKATYTDEIEILDSIMGKDNYILSVYTADRGNVTNAPIASWLTITNPDTLVQKCQASGGLYIAGINASDSSYNAFTDDDWKDLAKAVHEAGYLISFVSAYTGEKKSQKLFAAGFDASGSGWGINEIENGNLCNLFAGADFSDFTTDGTVTDGTLTLENGDTITPSVQLDSVFLGGGSLHITYNGSITLSFGNYINDSFTSDGTTDMWFSTYFEEAIPTFEITATANTEVYDLTYKASNV